MASAIVHENWLRRLRGRIRDAPSIRSWSVDANDGIIATAGLLEGFAGAGADDRVLLLAATGALIAGSLAVGGAKWAESAAEREAQLRLVAEETEELAADPAREVDELAAYYEAKGLDSVLARRVAHQLSEHDALTAQLESEHGISEIMPRSEPLWTGLASAASFAIGALIPLLISAFVPVAFESWAIVLAVVVSLAITSTLVARSGGTSIGRMLARTIAVGVGTLAVSYLAGSLLF